MRSKIWERPITPGTGLLLACLVLGTVILWNYAPLITTTYVADDFHYVVAPETPLWERVLEGRHGAFYRPVPELAYAIQNRLFQVRNHHFYHLVNLALHWGVSILVLLLLRGLDRPLREAAAGALLFASLPVQAETVCWVSNQAELLAAAAGLGALLLLLRFRRDGALPLYLGALLLTILALGAKGTALTLPFLAGLVSLADGWSSGDAKRRPRLHLVLPMLGIALGYLLYRQILVGELGVYGTSRHLSFDRTTLAHLALYLEDLVGPGRRLVVAPRFWLLPAALALGALGGRWGLLWTAWFGVALLPSAPMYGSRFLYVPALGFAALIANYTGRLLSRLGPRRAAQGTAALLALLICWSHGPIRDFLSIWRFSGDQMADRSAQAADLIRGVPPGTTVFLLDVPQTVDGIRFSGSGIAMRARIFANLERKDDLQVHQIQPEAVMEIPLSTGPAHRFLRFAFTGVTVDHALESTFRARSRLYRMGIYPPEPRPILEPAAPIKQDWLLSRDLSPLETMGAHLLSRGRDPHLVHLRLDIPTVQYHAVRLQMSILSDAPVVTGQFFWSLADRPGFSEEQQTRFTFPADGRSREVLLPLANHPWWIGDRRVDALRLDPCERPAEIHLDRLELVPAPGAGTYQGLLLD